MLGVLHVILFFPGYVFLGFFFFFPTEWGKNRNVALSGRQWRARRYFAPLHSLWMYWIIFSVFWPDIVTWLIVNDWISYETGLELMPNSGS